MVKLATKLGLAVVGVGFTAFMATPALAGMTFTLEGAGVQDTTLTGQMVRENFESLDLGVTQNYSLANGIGTINSAKIEAANQYGGAGGSGNYLRGGSTITFNEAQAYLGFWWSAGDSSNNIELFGEDDASLGFYSTSLVSDFINALPQADRDAYSGNPNSQFLNKNSGEYYSYLNFFGTEGTKVKKMVLSGGNFESDNFAFSTKARSTSGDILSGEAATVPEPTTILGLMATAVVGMISTRRRQASALNLSS
jgi:hypothetical protein